MSFASAIPRVAVLACLLAAGCSKSGPSGPGAGPPEPRPTVGADLKVVQPAFAIDPQFQPNPKSAVKVEGKPEVSDLEFSRDGTRLVVRSAQAQNGLQVWDVGDRPARLRSWDRRPGGVMPGLLSPDGRRFVYLPEDFGAAFAVDDVDSGRRVGTIKTVASGPMAFGPPDALFGLTPFEKRVSVLVVDAATGEKRSQFPVHDGPADVRASRPFADGRQVAVFRTAAMTIDVWDLAAGRRLRQVTPPFESSGRGLFTLYVNPTGTRMAAVAPSGSRMAGTDVGTDLIAWNGESGVAVGRVPRVGGFSQGEFLPGRDMFLMPSFALQDPARPPAREVVAFDLRSRQYAAVFRGGHTDHITALAVSPDGRRLATGDRTGQVRLWDLRTLP